VATVQWNGSGSQANTFLLSISGRYNLVAYSSKLGTEGDFTQAQTIVENSELGGSTTTGLMHFATIIYQADAGRSNDPDASADTNLASVDYPALNPTYARVSGFSSNGRFSVRWLKGC